MTNNQTPPDWVLIEAMAQAMAQTEYPAMSYEELATAALNTLRDTLEPVGWMYEHSTGPLPKAIGSVRHDAGDFYMMQKRGWTETPLYALPELKP